MFFWIVSFPNWKHRYSFWSYEDNFIITSHWMKKWICTNLLSVNLYVTNICKYCRQRSKYIANIVNTRGVSITRQMWHLPCLPYIYLSAFIYLQLIFKEQICANAFFCTVDSNLHGFALAKRARYQTSAKPSKAIPITINHLQKTVRKQNSKRGKRRIF